MDKNRMAPVLPKSQGILGLFKGMLLATFYTILVQQIGAQVSTTNQVLSLDANGSYVTVPSAPELQNPSEITIEAWIRPQQAIQNNTLYINKSDNVSGDSSRSYELQWVANADSAGPGKSVRFIVFLNNGSWAVVSAPAAEDQWVHVAASFSSIPGVLQLYTNGVLAVVTTKDAGGSSPLTGTLLRQTTLPVRFGAAEYSPYYYARGYMDEIRIWNKARTPEEISRDRSLRLTGAESNLAGYWTFNDGMANDLTGHGHNGTLTGGATTISATLFPADPVAPTITQEPQSQTTVVGTNVTFTVAATGTPPLTYQWKFKGTAIMGATSASLTLNSVSSANAGSYTVDVSNGMNTVTSASAILTLKTPVSITQQPKNQAVVEGGKVTFTAVAAGTPPLTYQWRTNGIPISGATAASLTLLNVQPSESGTYSLVVANPWSTRISTGAILTVLTPCIAGSNQPPITDVSLIAPSDGLLALFRLDGSDSSLFIQTNQVQFVADRFGKTHQAMLFPDSGFVGSLERDFFKNRKQWSWLGWIRPNKVESQLQLIYSEGNRGVSGYIALQENKIIVRLWNENVTDNWTDCTTLPVIQSGKWQHVAVTFDASVNQIGMCRVHVNGTEVFSGPLTMEKATDSVRLFYRDFCFGANVGSFNNDQAPEVFYGAIDDVLIYSRVLSQSEIDLVVNPPNGILNLTGTGDYVSVTNALSLQNSNSITIESWIYPVPNATNPNAYFLSKGAGSSLDSPRTYELSWTPDNRAYFSLFTGQSTWSLLGAPVPEYQWTHIAATFNGADGWFRLYTNGVMAAATTNDLTGQFPLLGQSLRQTSLPLVLGCSFSGAPLPGTFATGQMDELRIWNRALSGQEILQGICQRLSGSESNLVSYWNFDDGIAHDITKQGHDGTLAGQARIVPMNGFDIIHNVIGFNGATFDRRGQVVMSVTARSGANIRIDASTNLVDWVTVGTVLNNQGTIQFTDPDTLKFIHRFYRAVLP